MSAPDRERSPDHAPFRGPALLRALRPHHAVKNLLVFVPLLMAHEAGNADLMVRAALAFLAFSLVASGGYVANDLVDRKRDRAHPRKRSRPLAAGELSPSTGRVLATLLLGGGFAVGATLGWSFAGWLLGYAAATLAYSLFLRSFQIIDVLALSALYLVRILAGGAAVEVHVSPWLLAFSGFLFLSLAFAKRVSELHLLATSDAAAWEATGRGYRPDDAPLLEMFGTSSGYLSVLVLALYISGPQVGVHYVEPAALWLLCPVLLYWISRLWLLTHRGEVDTDPLVFALRDGWSYLAAGMAALLWLWASGWNAGR